MIINGQQYMNEKEVAAYYETSLPWVRRMRYSNKNFPYYKMVGRVYFSKTELDKWFKENLKAM
jgi:predicted DNA-binding transcriptional regulator AlpA